MKAFNDIGIIQLDLSKIKIADHSNVKDKLCKLLTSCTFLEFLDLSKCNFIHPMDIRNILNSIKENYYLSKIHMIEDFTTPQALELVNEIETAVTEPLQENISLTEFMLFSK